METEKIIPFLMPTRGRLFELVSELLILEEQLKYVEKQSFYFRLGLNSHLRRREELLIKYDRIRQEFNKTCLIDLVSAIVQNKKYLRLRQNLNPRIASMIVRNITLEKISKTTEFITLKSFTDILPPFEVLREDFKILRDILR